MNCPNCGNSLPDGTKFCTFCGTRMAAPAVAPMIQEPVYEPQPEPSFEPAPEPSFAPVSEPVYEAPVNDTPIYEDPAPAAPVAEEPAAPSFEPTSFAPIAFDEPAPAPAPSFQSQNQGFQPQNQGFQPQNQGFQPQNQGFQPQNQGFQPQNQGFQPQNQGFQPQNQGFQPQGQGFQPQNQGFQPQNQGFQPQYPGFQPQGPGTQPQKGKAGKADKPKKKSKVGLIIGILVPVLLIAAAVIYFLLNGNPFAPKDPDPVTINLADYVTVEFEGYSGKGTVSKETFDDKQLLEDFEEQIQWTNAAKKNYKAITESYDSAAEFAFEGLYGYVEYNDNNYALKNDDKVKWVWGAIDAEYIATLTNAELVFDDFDITVKGLEDVEMFDPFEVLTWTFSGNSGNGYVELTVNSDDPMYDSENGLIYFWVENNYSFKNGDQARIYIDEALDDLILEQYGKLPTTHEKFVTVEGLPFYVEAFEDIPESLVNEMNTYFIDFLTNDIVGAKIDGITDVKVSYYDSVYTVETPDTYQIDTNRLYNIYKVDFKAAGTAVTYYYYTLFTDMFIDAEGNCTYWEGTVDNYDYPADTFTYEYTVPASGDKEASDHSLTIRGYKTLDELKKVIEDQNTDYTMVRNQL